MTTPDQPNVLDLSATRYLVPLKEGGSLPAIVDTVDADENETGLFCWIPAPEGKLSYEECRALDSCTEGGGDESGGGCYKWSEGSEGYFYPWACEFYEGEQCYWEENETGLFCWVPAPEGEVDLATCEALDSCSGGGGKSGGGCYKWAGTSVSVGQPW